MRRGRLHDLLDQGRRRPLALVSAPAGYGKSTLVSHWLESRDEPSAWLSLDETDGDLRVFLQYLVAAVRTVAPEACPQTLATSPSSRSNAWTRREPVDPEANTMRRAHILVTFLPLLLAVPPLFADDIRDAERLLCTAVQVTQCLPDGECLTLPPWEVNVPQFIEVDLANLRLNTTKASGENRSTPIKTLEREGGPGRASLIFLQGVENGRAFSFVIAEETGMASIAVARDGLAVSVFGACTPMPAAGGE